ncbi:MAG: PAS domain S-box protein, partial [Chitinivibrionales bacterium]|nr:PAS domain S-box protein [Chitinivibrionales bacterium]MBD3396374.1 PAS domain S-box protein [Chitinivibrionales bacterium]
MTKRNKNVIISKVIIAEDDEGVNLLIQKAIEREGFETIGVFSGSDAVEVACENPNALMLLDYKLPDMSGKEVVAEIQARNSLVPFIIMTGFGDEKTAVTMMKMGALEYIVKEADFLEMVPQLVAQVAEEIAAKRRLGELQLEVDQSEQRYRSLFDNMVQGFAVHKLVTEGDRPVDYVFLESNKAFEALTGLQCEKIKGKRVTEVLPGIEKDPADWIGRYGAVALGGGQIRFEQFSQPLKKWYSVIAYSPERGYFCAIFQDITERKRAEQAQRDANAQLTERVKEQRCLHEIARLSSEPDLSRRDILERAANALPAGWHYPEDTCARITVGAETYRSEGFAETALRMAADFTAEGTDAGRVEVYCRGGKPDADEGPFLHQERALINSVAVLLGNIITRKRHEERLIELNRRLAAGEQQLRATNQQLTASDQQLRAANQSLAANEQQLRSANQQLVSNEQALRAANQQLQQRERALEDAIKELETEQERFRALFELAPDAYYITDLKGVFIDGNAAAEKLVGMPRGELIGKSLAKAGLLAPGDIPRALANLAKNALGKSTGPDEFTLHRRDGSTFDVEIITQPVRIGGKRVVLGIARDVTDRNKAESHLRETRQRMELALKGANLGTWDWNVRTGEVRFDERWAEMKGYRLDELKPHVSTWEDMVHSEDLPGVYELLNAHFDGKTDFYEAEFRVKNKSGEWIWIADRGRVIERDEKGKPIRACGTHHDITAYRYAQEELRKSEEIWRSLVENAPNLIHIVDSSGTIQFINHVEPGFARDDVVGRSQYDFISPEYRAVAKKAIQKVFATGESAEYEATCDMPDGSRKWYETQVGAVKDKGAVVSALLFSRDLTEWKESQAERQRLEDQFRQAQKMEAIGQLAGGVAHDFNNSLGGIMGYADLLKIHLRDNQRLKKYADRIGDSVNRAAALTRQLLAFARRGRLERQAVNVHEAIRETGQMLKQTIDRRIDIQHDIHAKPSLVSADPGQLANALLNLAINARDAMPEGGTLTFATRKVNLQRNSLAAHGFEC